MARAAATPAAEPRAPRARSRVLGRATAPRRPPVPAPLPERRERAARVAREAARARRPRPRAAWPGALAERAVAWAARRVRVARRVPLVKAAKRARRATMAPEVRVPAAAPAVPVARAVATATATTATVTSRSRAPDASAVAPV